MSKIRLYLDEDIQEQADGQDAHPTRVIFSCGMGILPVLIIFARGLVLIGEISAVYTISVLQKREVILESFLHNSSGTRWVHSCGDF